MNKLLKQYIVFLKKHLNVRRPLRVVFDCSNGVTGLVLKELFRNNSSLCHCDPPAGGEAISKIKPIFINSEPNGNFPAHGPDPLKKGALNQIQKEVKKQKADLGVVFDGDGDRVFFIDDKGQEIDPDIIGFILMKIFKSPYIVSTINSYRVKSVQKTFIAKVGHLFMKKAMREHKANVGMERSGHFYFKDFFYCDSGIFTAIQMINFIGNQKQKISDYAEGLPKYYQIPETNFSASGGEIELEKWVENKIAEAEAFYKKSAVAIKKNDGLLMEFGDWWFSLRLSNSEYLLRLNMEAKSKELLNKKFKEINNLLVS